MSIDFHRLMEPINNNRLIFIDYIDYIDCVPMIDFHRLDRPGEAPAAGAAGENPARGTRSRACVAFLGVFAFYLAF